MSHTGCWTHAWSSERRRSKASLTQVDTCPRQRARCALLGTMRTIRREGDGAPIRIGVDIGGTFTDAVAICDDGREVSAKALSTPDDLVDGVMAAVAGLGVDWADIGSFIHGTT